MHSNPSNTFDETPYRAFLYEFFGDFFRGIHNETWRDRWKDALTITNALCDENIEVVLPDEVAFAQAYAQMFYGVGSVTVPLAQSCWENEQALHCGNACREAHELYARHGLVNKCSDHLPDDHIGIVLPFAAYLLRQNEYKDLRKLIVDGVSVWWPHAEALLRQQDAWNILAPILTTFHRFLCYEKKLLSNGCLNNTDQK